MFSKIALVAASAIGIWSLASAASAQEVTLRLQQFLPTAAPVPTLILKPWAERIEAASDGRIKIDHFDGMALGGTPPALMDQARDGIVDIVMTLPGYTPGRFLRSEVFELPFFMTDPVATGTAFWDLIESDLQEAEFADVKVLSGWVHGPGLLHTKKEVASLEEMAGLQVRGPTRLTNALLEELGATPVGMPFPSIPEALSKGVVDGTMLPWEVAAAVKLPELVGYHTEFGGNEALYTTAIVLVMNQARCNSLPEDLRAIIDRESGKALSEIASGILLDLDAPVREMAVANGNTIIKLDEAEVDRWKAAGETVTENWVAEMAEKGIDGSALIEKAKGFIQANGG